MDIDRLIEDVKNYCASHLSEKRWAHSLRVAEMCAEICELSGYDTKKGYFCGIAHDICKEIDHDEMKKIVEESEYAITPSEYKKVSLLHGKAGAALLKKNFGVDDSEVLFAIAYHVCGSADFGILGKALYVADKNERGRPHVKNDPDFVRKLYTNSVDDMFYYTVKGSYDYMVNKPGFIIMDDTMEVIRALGIAD